MVVSILSAMFPEILLCPGDLQYKLFYVPNKIKGTKRCNNYHQLLLLEYSETRQKHGGQKVSHPISRSLSSYETAVRINDTWRLADRCKFAKRFSKYMYMCNFPSRP